MSSGRLLTLVLCFFMDVRVHAEECWEQKWPCAIRSKSHRKNLEGKDLKMSLAPKAVIDARAQNHIQVVYGSIYAEVGSAKTFAAAFGSVTCEQKCKVIFERTSGRLRIFSLAGTWSIKRLGDTASYRLPAGYQMLLSEVGTDGKAGLEFPQALPWDSTLKTWAELYPGPFEDFKKAVADFRVYWVQAIEEGSKLQAQEAGRAIASHEASLAAARARQKREEQEDESLRKLFREKNNIYP